SVLHTPWGLSQELPTAYCLLTTRRKGVTSNRTMRFIVGSLPGLAITLGIAPAHTAAAACPPAVALRPRLECPAAIISSAGLPTHGGTITIYPGIQAPCVVRLPGGAILCAGGETAAT